MNGEKAMMKQKRQNQRNRLQKLIHFIAKKMCIVEIRIYPCDAIYTSSTNRSVPLGSKLWKGMKVITVVQCSQ